MLQSIIEGVEETGEPVRCVDTPRARTIGFHMEQIQGDDYYWWTWEIHTDDLNRCLKTPEWNHLDNGGDRPEALIGFRTARGRARIAAILSEGKLP